MRPATELAVMYRGFIKQGEKLVEDILNQGGDLVMNQQITYTLEYLQGQLMEATKSYEELIEEILDSPENEDWLNVASGGSS